MGKSIALILLVVAGVYSGAWNLGFTNYDDPDYVTQNEIVRRGLTPEGVKWAFTTDHAANWHPLTWLSHMLDVEMFGAQPAGPHVINVLLHALSSVLLLVALATATGARNASLMVALLFAVHPMQVETVAWISSRKGLWSSALSLAALLLYVKHAHRPSRARWIGVHALFALGLMAKPMLVTWPLVLVLVDRWPLQRTDRWPRLFAEKTGLFALAAASALITFLVQRGGGAVADLEQIPIAARMANALVSYARYVLLLVWPSSLATPYPHPYLSPQWGAWPTATLVGSGLFIVGLAASSWWLTRDGRRTWWRVGMLWFAGMLVPVIGLVHVGNQAMADRYVYLPSIGLFLAAVWLARRALERRPALRNAAIGLSVVAIGGYAALAHAHLKTWSSSRTLFEHATQHTRDNWLAWNNLGMAYSEEGRHEEALAALDRSLIIRPDYVDAHFNRGNALSRLKRFGEAEKSLRQALDLAPQRTDVLANLALALLQQGRAQAALPLVERAVALAPGDVTLRINQAATLLTMGERERALQVVENALRDLPRTPPEARRRLLEMQRYLRTGGS